MTAVTAPAYAALIPADVAETVRAHRAFAEIVADLGERHDRHVAAIAAFETRFNAWSARVDDLAGRERQP